ncbi:MAG: hypothetical protein ACOX1V_04690 [Candidatus Iainarchaeum sp.]|jgi:hypothetical protein|nr:MAG: hypothetical protein BWY55_00710 [archaeon ADurb.Bin336]
MVRTRKPNKTPQKFWTNPKTDTVKASNQAFQKEQTNILKIVDSIMPQGVKPVNDRYSGVDYRASELTIDRKFGFWKDGSGTIKIRIKNGELINTSDCTMIMHKDRIELFPTQIIRDYVKKHPEKVMFDSTNLPPRVKKGQVLFEEARIVLSDLYKAGKVTPTTIAIPLEKIAQGKVKFKMGEAGKMQTLMKRAIERTQVLNILKNKGKKTPSQKFFVEMAMKKQKGKTLKSGAKKVQGKVKLGGVNRKGNNSKFNLSRAKQSTILKRK